MKYEVKIFRNHEFVKKTLEELSTFYQEDFLLDDIVFIQIEDIKQLKAIQEDIEVSEEQYAYQ